MIMLTALLLRAFDRGAGNNIVDFTTGTPSGEQATPSAACSPCDAETESSVPETVVPAETIRGEETEVPTNPFYALASCTPPSATPFEESTPMGSADAVITPEIAFTPSESVTVEPTAPHDVVPTNTMIPPQDTDTPEQTNSPIQSEIRQRSISYMSRGAAVQATICVPEKANCPLVIMLHGFMGDREQFGGFRLIADELLKEGVATIRMDFAGCGDSTESFENLSLDSMKEDAINALNYMKKNYDINEDRIGILGFSMGGRAALEIVAESLATPHMMWLIAPAASTSGFIDLLGGKAKWQSMYEDALNNGYASYQGVRLSAEFFECFLRYENPAQDAKDRFHGSALVAYSRNDQAVPWTISQNVADVLQCEVLAFETGGHACGLNLGAGNTLLSAQLRSALRMLK